MVGSKKERTVNWPKPDELISLEKASKLSGLSSSHLRRLVTRKEIWGIKVGRNWVTTEQEVREYIARERRTGPKSSRKKLVQK